MLANIDKPCFSGHNPRMSQSAPRIPLEDPETVAFRQAVADGLSSLDAGKNVPYEQIRDWLLSWGTKSELPPPECP